MKKAFFTLFLIVMFIIGCATGGTTPASNLTADDLDPAIREASTYLNTRIPQGRKAVFLNITSDYPDLSEYILSLLSENAVNDGIFSVVDRVQLDTLRAEMNFQLSGEVDDDSAQAIGKLLGA
ncbi:MAG: CsgG/HfaB family protein, partial [Treponema sp.]|nr:CsgG/HfaB family protein [Treponema sp.]